MADRRVRTAQEAKMESRDTVPGAQAQAWKSGAWAAVSGNRTRIVWPRPRTPPPENRSVVGGYHQQAASETCLKWSGRGSREFNRPGLAGSPGLALVPIVENCARR